MTDPDAVKDDEQEEAPPPPPPRPAAGHLSQMEADEQYARQLAEHYDRAGSHAPREPRPYARNRNETGLKPNELYDDREHSFLDDDLPVIRDHLRKGFAETQTKVNSWITTFKQRLDDAFEDDEGHQQGGAAHGRRPGEPSSRRSGDYERYDADPQVITDDFAGMRLSADGSMSPFPSLPSPFPVPSNMNPQQSQHRSNEDPAPIRDGRAPANSNVFQPPPPSKSPKPADGRRVAFKETTEDIDAYSAPPKTGARAGTPPGNKQSKWQPLSSVDPNPIADNDPFTLGDSEDEREAREKGQGDKGEDGERLRRAAAEAMADSLVEGKGEGKEGAKGGS